MGTSRSRPAGCRIASLRPLVVPPSCPAPSITIALTLAPSIVCCRHAVSPCHCCAAALPPLPPLPPPLLHRQAAADVALPRCRRCHAAAKLPPTLRCRAATLPPPPCRRQAAADVALLHCRHRRSRCQAATALPPSRCALPRPSQIAANIALSRCRHCRCHRCHAAVHWLVVVLLSAVQFWHRMPSCNRRRSRCCWNPTRWVHTYEPTTTNSH